MNAYSRASQELLESFIGASGEPHRSFGEPAAEAMKMPLKASSWVLQRFNKAVKRRFMELYVDRMLYKEGRFPSVKLNKNTTDNTIYHSIIKIFPNRQPLRT